MTAKQDLATKRHKKHKRDYSVTQSNRFLVCAFCASLWLTDFAFDSAVGDEPHQSYENVESEGEPRSHKGQRNPERIDYQRYLALEVGTQGRSQQFIAGRCE